MSLAQEASLQEAEPSRGPWPGERAEPGTWEWSREASLRQEEAAESLLLRAS